MTDEFDAVARSEVQPGWDVYSADDERIGAVDEVTQAGFSVGLVSGGTARIEFSDIESADDGRVDLALSADELPPAVREETPGAPPPPDAAESPESPSLVEGQARPSQAEGPEQPGAETAPRPPRPSQAEGEREEAPEEAPEE